MSAAGVARCDAAGTAAIDFTEVRYPLLVYVNLREIYGCRTSSIASCYARNTHDRRLMSNAFRQSLNSDYLTVDQRSRERPIDTRSRNRDDGFEDDFSAQPTMQPPKFKVCDSVKLNQVLDSVLDLNTAYYRIRTQQAVCNSIIVPATNSHS